MHHTRGNRMMHPTCGRRESACSLVVVVQRGGVSFPAAAFLCLFGFVVHFVELPGCHERVHCQSTDDEFVVRFHYATSCFSGCIPLIWQTSW